MKNKILILALVLIVLNTSSSAYAKPVYVDGKDMPEIMKNAFNIFEKYATHDRPISVVCKLNICEYDLATNESGKEHGKPIPFTDGWQESVWSSDSSGTSTVAKAWYVPSAPPVNAGQVIFFFDGKEGGNPLTILQPVLDWNWGGSGRWQIASWYVGSQNYRSSFLNVDVGDTIFGSVALDQWNHWTIYAWDVQKQIATGIGTQDSNPYNWRLEALETYYVNACNQYSGASTFNPYAYAGFPVIPTLDWSIHQTQTGCGLNTVVQYIGGNDYVTFYSQS